MAEISWTAEAQRWLEDIFEYIATENPRAASHARAWRYSLAPDSGVVLGELRPDVANHPMHRQAQTGQRGDPAALESQPELHVEP
jgi:plasmid stabilization system protein ParE